jgi:hypothetical protein
MVLSTGIRTVGTVHTIGRKGNLFAGGGASAGILEVGCFGNGYALFCKLAISCACLLLVQGT